MLLQEEGLCYLKYDLCTTSILMYRLFTAVSLHLLRSLFLSKEVKRTSIYFVFSAAFTKNVVSDSVVFEIEG